ncbi:MAG: response regulator, partial [Chlorobi bacterium]|nr:response regulator [Chlorobiota bacterium]
MLLNLCLFSQENDQNYVYIHSVKGIENPVVTCVFQDSQDFIWYGSLNGLYRWDGFKARHFHQIPGDTTSLPFDIIISILFEDEDNRLWMSTLGQGLVIYDKFSDRFISNPLTIKNDPERIDLIWVKWATKDRDSILWGIGGTNIFFRYDLKTGECDFLLPEPSDISNPANEVAALLYDPVNQIFWTGTKAGLYKYSISENRFFAAAKSKITESIEITSIIEEQPGVIWVGTSTGLFQYNDNEQTWENFNSTPGDSLNVRDIFQNPLDGNKSLWIITEDGIKKFNKKKKTFTHYSIKYQGRQFTTTQFIATNKGRHLDENGFLWIATENLGAAVINLNESPFRQYRIGMNKTEKDKNGATAFHQDDSGNLWIGTGFNGLYKYDQNMMPLAAYHNYPGDNNSLSHNYVQAILEGTDGHVWVGTENGLNRLGENEEVFQHFLDQPIEFQGGLDFVRITVLFQDTTGRLWAGTTQGAYFSDNSASEEPVFRQYEAIPSYFTTISKIYRDKSGNLWFTTPVYRGIFKLTGEPGQPEATIRYRLDPENPEIFPLDGALSILEDEKENLYFGTKSGLYKWDQKNNLFELFNKENGLDANIIYWMEKDNQGNFWLSTERGLIRFNPSNPGERKSKIFTFKDGVPFEDIYPVTFYKSPDGRMYIGGRRGSGNGFYSFHPDSIKANTHIPNIVLTGFSVHNNNYPFNDKMISTGGVKLKHNENFISFEFAALDYFDPEKNQYAYYLEGFENSWNYVGNRHFANYTGVPPGKYIFRVKGSNNDGYWNEAGTSLAITILPPPWKTWWAYLLYAVSVASVFISIFYFYFRRKQLLHNLELEQVQSEKLKELDSIKTRFFSNISHEFRTPLTLILGPLQNMIGRSTSKKDKRELTVMQRNARRLQQLINQLLDLSKLEAGKMQLSFCETNIAEWIKMYVQSFESLARQRKIELVFEAQQPEIICFFDPEKLAQVLSNLLSNAFKFTEEGGKIEVVVSNHTPLNPPEGGKHSPAESSLIGETKSPPIRGDGRGVIITISDTGPGIPPEQIEHIFDRFYQADDAQTRQHEGTGIGLALVKELVELHHGSITVESIENKGATFIIFLPQGKDHLKQEEIVSKPSENIEIEQPAETVEPVADMETTVESAGNDFPVLMIVEDNADMRHYIRGFFDETYRILEAADGKQGFELALKHIPDIIISDVMMPVMDGYALCRKIKTDERTSHIPLILLTARSSGADKIEGLETGADDFVIKPFDGKELQVRVNNLIEQRKRLRDLLYKRMQKSALTAPEDMEANGITSMDEQFLQKLYKTVSVYFSDPEFNVEGCCRE